MSKENSLEFIMDFEHRQVINGYRLMDILQITNPSDEFSNLLLNYHPAQEEVRNDAFCIFYDKLSGIVEQSITHQGTEIKTRNKHGFNNKLLSIEDELVGFETDIYRIGYHHQDAPIDVVGNHVIYANNQDVLRVIAKKSRQYIIDQKISLKDTLQELALTITDDYLNSQSIECYKPFLEMDKLQGENLNSLI